MWHWGGNALLRIIGFGTGLVGAGLVPARLQFTDRLGEARLELIPFLQAR